MATGNQEKQQTTGRSANNWLALGLLGVVAMMVGLSFAAVPLYRMFCQVTGYGGTTQRAEGPAGTILDREITVRFDSTVSSELDWSFQPVQRKVKVKIGENKLIFYKAVNRSDEKLTGTASFNVTPEITGSYFSKIQCFCFTEQTLQPHQKVDMAVSFYIDPAIMDDPDASRIEEITLSYTFFRSDGPDTSAEAAPNQRNGLSKTENAKWSG